MKIYSILLMFLITTVGFSQQLKTQKTYYDPITATKIKEVYTVLNTPPYLKHGKYEKFDQRGLKGTEINYSNGKAHGIAKEYYLPQYGFPGDEKVKTITNFNNGLKEGKSTTYTYVNNNKLDLKNGDQIIALEQYFEKDKLIREVKYYTDGKKEYDGYIINGPVKKWYPNGQLKEEYTVKDSKINGIFRFYYENGQIGKEGEVVMGKENGKWTHYFENGEIELQENYENGKLSEVVTYYDTGIVEKKERLDNGNFLFTQLKVDKPIFQAEILPDNKLNGDLRYAGIYKRWYNNSQLHIEGSYKRQGSESYKDGSWIIYEPNGEVLTTGEYNTGNKIGKWRIYYNQEWEETYLYDEASYYREIELDDNGSPIGQVKDYYITGALQWQGELKSINPDIRNGQCIGYYENGTKQSEAYFENGLPVGTVKEWYANGNIKLIGEYSIDQNAKAFGNFRVVESGTWEYYNVDGSLENKEIK